MIVKASHISLLHRVAVSPEHLQWVRCHRVTFPLYGGQRHGQVMPVREHIFQDQRSFHRGGPLQWVANKVTLNIFIMDAL